MLQLILMYVCDILLTKKLGKSANGAYSMLGLFSAVAFFHVRVPTEKFISV